MTQILATGINAYDADCAVFAVNGKVAVAGVLRLLLRFHSRYSFLANSMSPCVSLLIKATVSWE